MILDNDCFSTPWLAHTSRVTTSVFFSHLSSDHLNVFLTPQQWPPQCFLHTSAVTTSVFFSHLRSDHRNVFFTHDSVSIAVFLSLNFWFSVVFFKPMSPTWTPAVKCASYCCLWITIPFSHCLSPRTKSKLWVYHLDSGFLSLVLGRYPLTIMCQWSLMSYSGSETRVWPRQPT